MVIAENLEALGVDIIEAGFHVSSPADLKSVEESSKTIKYTTVCRLTRAIENDIRIAAEALKYALFEPIHGSFPQATGKNIANPIASILSAAMLLDHFGLESEANLIREAVEKSLELEITTPDLNQSGMSVTTDQFGDFIEDYISHPEDTNINFLNIHLGQSTIIYTKN